MNFRSTLKSLSSFSEAATLVLRPYQGWNIPVYNEFQTLESEGDIVERSVGGDNENNKSKLSVSIDMCCVTVSLILSTSASCVVLLLLC